MGFELTGKYVSSTYDNLIQYIDGSYYNGLGVPINIADASSLDYILVDYIKEASLNSAQFVWNAGVLDISVAGGTGDVTLAYVDGSLNNIRSTYIPDASLSSDFYWNVSNLLRVNASTAGSVVNPDLDYITYTPRVSDVSFYYDGDNVSRILSISDIGTKDVSFVYNINGDVSTININNYGLWTKQVTFEKDVDENVIAVHIT